VHVFISFLKGMPKLFKLEFIPYGSSRYLTLRLDVDKEGKGRVKCYSKVFLCTGMRIAVTC
jgi:hypothetical protein